MDRLTEDRRENQEKETVVVDSKVKEEHDCHDVDVDKDDHPLAQEDQIQEEGKGILLNVNGKRTYEESQNETKTESSVADPQTVGTQNRAGYAKIKQEFLVPDHKPTLCTEYLSAEVKEKLDVPDEDNSGDDDEVEPPNNEGEPPAKKAKLKGRNKVRPKTEKIKDKDRICPAIKGDRECRFGDNCKFSHNKAEFMSQKLPELDGGCYNFDTFGFCAYGIACRFAKNHLSEDLQNIVNKDLFEKMKGQKPLNDLDTNVRQQLWKRKYNFKKADKSVKEVNKNFRGWSGDSSSKTDHMKQQGEQNTGVKEGEQSKSVPSLSSPPSSNLLSQETGANNSVSVTNDTVSSSSNNTSVNSVEPTTPQAETVTNSNPTPSQAESVNSSNPTAMQGDQCPQGAPTEKITSGLITDEELFPLRPQERNKLDWSNKLYLAPLTTVGNLPFRRICKGYGVDITCGEMALVNQLLKAKQSEWSLIKRHPCEDIFGVQICGSYPDTMTRCAQLLTETCDIDFIDINCGCPIDLVYKKGAGSALMGKVTKLEQICRSMIPVMGGTPLTVKLRTGVFDNKCVAHQITSRLRDAGVSLVTVHGRSREQRYTKLADWDYIGQCAAAGAPMPVFGNGDVLSYEDANLHMQHTGVSGVMVARGALIKPWIFTEIKEQRHWDISSNERFDMLKTYTNYGLEHWGSDHQGVENTRRFLLEWLSFLYRYIPVGVLEQVPQRINERPPYYVGRNDLETLMASASCADWVKISEMLLGPVPPSFKFLPKHKANAYQ